MPPDTETMLRFVQTLHHVSFDPHTNQVNSDPCTEVKSTVIPRT